MLGKTLTETLTAEWWEQGCLLRLNGVGDLEASQQIKQYLVPLIQKGVSHLAINLSRCPYMSSVFVGTLLNLTEQLQEKFHQKLILVGLVPSHEKILKNFGVLNLFSLQPVPKGNGKRDIPIHTNHSTQLATARHLYDAHRHLMKQNSTNRRVFEPVVRLIRQEIRKLEGN